MTKTVRMVLEKETKGALRYMEINTAGTPLGTGDDDGALIGTLYLRKKALGARPTVIKVTVEE